MQPTEPDGWVAKAFLSLKFYVMKFWWHFDPFWAKLGSKITQLFGHSYYHDPSIVNNV